MKQVDLPGNGMDRSWMEAVFLEAPCPAMVWKNGALQVANLTASEILLNAPGAVPRDGISRMEHILEAAMPGGLPKGSSGTFVGEKRS